MHSNTHLYYVHAYEHVFYRRVNKQKTIYTQRRIQAQLQFKNKNKKLSHGLITVRYDII